MTSLPAGINCTTAGGACTAPFAAGTAVTLTQTPDAGSFFGGWSGDCNGVGGCTVTMDANRNVQAGFGTGGPPPGPPPGPPGPGGTFTLTVGVIGIGSGVVTSLPAGINCTTAGGACGAQFAAGTVVTLTATPDAGSFFGGWGPGACVGLGGCSVTMDADKSVNAAFGPGTPPGPVTAGQTPARDLNE